MFEGKTGQIRLHNMPSLLKGSVVAFTGQVVHLSTPAANHVLVTAVADSMMQIPEFESVLQKSLTVSVINSPKLLKLRDRTMNRLKQIIVACCMLFMLTATAMAEQIYRSVDADGNVTFSNEPPADAVDVDEVKVRPGPSAAEQQAARERMQAQEATASELGEARASRVPQRPAPAPNTPAVVEPVEPVNQYYGYPNRRPPLRDQLPDRPVQLPVRPLRPPARPVQLPVRPVPR